MWLSYYFILFCIYSCMGWIFETIYCTVKTGRWDNRGFLFGPACPIYGSGAVAVSIIFQMLEQNNGGTVPWWTIYIASVLGSAVLEFVTSWVMEKLFHASWWDYSDMPFNIQGRVCLQNALLFGVAGLVVYYWIFPTVSSFLQPVAPIALEAAGLLLMAVLAGDCTLTVCALTNLDEAVRQSEETLNIHMEQFVQTVGEYRQDIEEKLSEERKRFAKQHAERTVQKFGYTKRSALKRIVKVRSIPQREKYDRHRKILFEALKKDK